MMSEYKKHELNVNCIIRPTSQIMIKIITANKKNTIQNIAIDDQNVTGTKNVREVRPSLYRLKLSLWRDGSTPLLYFSDVNMTLGMNRKATENSAARLRRSAPPTVNKILKEEIYI